MQGFIRRSIHSLSIYGVSFFLFTEELVNLFVTGGLLFFDFLSLWQGTIVVLFSSSPGRRRTVILSLLFSLFHRLFLEDILPLWWLWFIPSSVVAFAHVSIFLWYKLSGSSSRIYRICTYSRSRVSSPFEFKLVFSYLTHYSNIYRIILAGGTLWKQMNLR